MKATWKLEDFIDLDFFDHLDQYQADPAGPDIFTRDRQIYLDAKHQNKLNSCSHSKCLRLWLLHRRAEMASATGTAAPGQSLCRLLRFFKQLLFIVGLLLGIVSGASYFAYSGTTPLNVFSFFSFFILPQLALITLFFLRSLIARLSRKPLSHLNTILIPILDKLLKIAKKKIFSQVPPKIKKDFSRIILGQTRNLLKWPLFIYGQLFGISFNIGLVALTLMKVVTTDLAFGWQTTLQFGAEKLAHIVENLALPWSWFISQELSYPSLEQIEGSRIILKDGIYNLLTQDLTSWWPFLLLSLLFYGLLPRLMLLSIGYFLGKHKFHRFLQSRRFRRISRRMLTPLISTQAPEPPSLPENSHEQPKKTNKFSTNLEQSKTKATVLIPEEINEILTAELLETLLLPHGYIPGERKTVFRSYEADTALLQDISLLNTPVIVLLEAWMPPISEHLLFLEKLANLMKQETMLNICLLGRPQKNGTIAPPREEEVRLWKKKISHHCEAVYSFAIESSKEQQ